MGGKSSSRRRSFNDGQHYGYQPPPPSYAPSQPSYAQSQPSYAPSSPFQSQHPAYAPSPSPRSQSYAPPSSAIRPPKKTLERKYSRIADNYRTLDEVTAALAHAGLESSNLIVGIDFTKSNEWTGAKSFNRRSLHHIGKELNPYEEAISIIGKTLSAFDEDNLIPCYGFGDASTHDQDVFSFYDDDTYCQGFEEVLSRYRELVPQLRLAGPTSFAPVIEMAMTIVEQSGGQYHVLLIIADGQVTRSVDTQPGNLSPQEQKTIEAIVQASRRAGHCPERVCLPPPRYNTPAGGTGSKSYSRSSSFQQSAPSYPQPEAKTGASSSTPAYRGQLHLRHHLQVLLWITSFVPYALRVKKIWHLAVGIRRAVIVESFWRIVRFADVQSRLE